MTIEEIKLKVKENWFNFLLFLILHTPLFIFLQWNSLIELIIKFVAFEIWLGVILFIGATMRYKLEQKIKGVVIND